MNNNNFTLLTKDRTIEVYRATINLQYELQN